MNFQSDLEARFFNEINLYFVENLIESLYSIVHEPNLQEYSELKLSSRWIPDFLILKGKYPFIVVEIKGRSVLRDTLLGDRLLNEYQHQSELIGVDYVIITDLERWYVYTTSGGWLKRTGSLKSVFDSVVVKGLSEKQVNDHKAEIAAIIKKIVFESELLSQRGRSSGPTTKEFIQDENLYDNLIYDNDGRFYHFKQNYELGLQDFENRFFQTLLSTVDNEAICRYTTFESICATIQYKSYRMASHIAMNDRGEVDYVDRYLGVSYTPMANMTLAEVRQLNLSYISSCTTVDKEDDLTMYRLYAEDSKGVCLKFGVSNSCQHHNLLVRKISYAQSRLQHNELNLIRDIVTTVSLATGARFRFLYLDIWKHFFKSFDYAIEQEVRVLYLHNRGTTPMPATSNWIIAQPDRILSKYVTFNLEDPNFPLKLQKITLGPNAPEKAVNKKQLELLLDEKKLSNVDVEQSQIESYRKT